MKIDIYGKLPIVVLLIASMLLQALPCEGCFSIVVGKDASTDGSVIMAHNEDDTPPQIVHHSKMPRKKHAPGAKVTLRNGGHLDQVAETWAYIWSDTNTD